MLNYPALAKKESALNTPPVFQIYFANLVLKDVYKRQQLKTCGPSCWPGPIRFL